MKQPKPKLYKIIGICRTCRERFVVDMSVRYSSKNYCKTCVGKFKGGRE